MTLVINILLITNLNVDNIKGVKIFYWICILIINLNIGNIKAVKIFD